MELNRYSCFEEAETSLKFTIKEQIKEVLIINGFDNTVVLSKFDESDLENVEDFIKNEYHHFLSDEERIAFYGIYSSHPTQFKFLSGIKKQIALIAAYYRNKYNTPECTTTKSCQFTQTDASVWVNSLVNNATDTDTLSCDPTNFEEAETHIIMKALRSWIKTKVNNEQWILFNDRCDTFKIEILKGVNKQLSCNFICFCGHSCKLQKLSKKQTCRPRWIYANIHKHILKAHITASFTPNNDSQDKPEDKPKERQITDFFRTEPRSTALVINTALQNNSKRKVNVLQDISIPSSASNSQLSELRDCIIPDISDSCQEKQFKEIEIINDVDTRLSCLEGLGADSGEKIITAASTSTVSRNISKWRSEKYQRRERYRRKRENVTNNQLLITNFFDNLKKTSEIFDRNPELFKYINENLQFNEGHEKLPSQNVGKLLQTLCETSQRNVQKSKHKQTYDAIIKKFSVYLFYIGGRLLYEVLQANLKSILPSISTLNRFVQNQNKCCNEGSFDFENLKIFLKERNLPFVVWIAEDATRITGKIEYNSRNNTIMGFALPLKSGLPVKEAYLARSANVITEYFSNCPRANYAYVIMAQPLSQNAPAFCLSVYGTDNTFTHKDVLQRWKYLEKEANRHGIKIIGFSSDGDTRLLKAMRTRIKLPIPSQSEKTVQPMWPWYQVSMDHNSNADKWHCFIQDEIHIGTKLRNRLLKPNIHLPIGNYVISVTHIQKLVESQPKDRHFLTLSDINPIDRMNFKSVVKITSTEVLELLKDVPGSNGTISYLKVVNYILDAFLDKEMSLEKRLHHIWYAVFYFRIWRQWIKNHKTFKLKDNFITDNAYLCTELNAHNLIKLVCIFRDSKLKSDMFCPWLFSSQSCEKIFRTTRSMTTTMSTVVNFSIKDIIQRIGRIQVVNDIIEDLKDTITFPRENKQHIAETTINFENFTNDYIGQLVNQALNEVCKDLKSLGVMVDADSWNFISVKPVQLLENDYLDDDHDSDDHILCDIDDADVTQNKMFQDFVFEYTDPNTDLEHRGGANLKDYSDKVKQVSENSQYLEINLENGKTAIIKKSTFCWLLEEENGRVSTDRLRRFITSKRRKGKNQNLNPSKRLKKGKQVVDTSTSSSEQENEMNSFDESTDTSVYAENVDIYVSSDDEPDTKRLQTDKFYAVFYDQTWYIGKILEEVDKETFKLQFLRQNLNEFLWPKTADIAVANKKYIFYGPIKLIGNNPFQVSRYDCLKIKNKYKEMKQISDI